MGTKKTATTAEQLEQAIADNQATGPDVKVVSASIGRGPTTQDSQSPDERFYETAIAAADATIAHRNESPDAGAMEIRLREHVVQLGLGSLENPFANRDFSQLVAYVVNAIVDPRITVGNGDAEVRFPLGALRAIQNAVESEDTRALEAFIRSRYDTAGRILKAQDLLTENGVEVRQGRVSPGHISWLTSQLAWVAERKEREAKGFDAQRKAQGLRQLISGLETNAAKIFRPRDSRDVAVPEADASTATEVSGS